MARYGRILLSILLILSLLVGCTPTSTPDNTENPGEAKPLTLEELARLTVYPPEAAAHILSGSRDVLHFTYSELPDNTRWPE